MADEGALHEPFFELHRQHEAGRLGMLVFLASEIMLFGGIFAAALALRLHHEQSYIDAAHHLKLWIGTANTAVLLTSSLFAALAVTAARGGAPQWCGRALGAAAALGMAFLVLKAVEYAGEYHEGLMPGTPPADFSSPFERLFMDLYYLATGLHAVHVTTGIGLLIFTAFNRKARNDRSATFVGNIALYWHLVDIVWIFLFPTLYLAGVK
ncbi:MAG TPA: cytochrome c oxidase subunit 3 [Sphingomonadaceae bacterium]